MNSLLAAFFAQIVIVTYREYAGSGVSGGGINVPNQAPLNLPLPADYTAPVLIYGGLSLIPGQGQRLAGMIGWGLVVATLLNLWDPATGGVRGPGYLTAAQKAAVKNDTSGQSTTSSGNPLPPTRVSGN